MKFSRLLALFLAIAVSWMSTDQISAQDLTVGEGWSLYQTDFALFDLGNFNAQFEGVPIGTHDFGGVIGVQNTGLTDTIVQRLEPATENNPQVTTEIVALSLRSVEPIDIGAGIEFVSASIVSSAGTLTLLDFNEEDTFDSCFSAIVVQFTGEISGMMVTNSYALLGGLDWPWSGVGPADAVKIPGVNFQLKGGDFWTDEPIPYFDFGNDSMLVLDNARIIVVLGDVNLDGVVNLLDVAPFVDRISTGSFQAEADINQDGEVNLLDVQPFVDLLSG